MWASETASESREKHERKICCVFLIIIEKKTQTARWVDSMLVFNMIARFSWFLTRHSDAFSILSSPKNIYDLRHERNSTHERWLMTKLSAHSTNDLMIEQQSFMRRFSLVFSRCLSLLSVNLTFRLPSTRHRTPTTKRNFEIEEKFRMKFNFRYDDGSPLLYLNFHSNFNFLWISNNSKTDDR